MTTKASSTMRSLSFKFSPSPIAPRRVRPSHTIVHLSPFAKKTLLSLTLWQRISGFGSNLPQRLRTIASPSQKTLIFHYCFCQGLQNENPQVISPLPKLVLFINNHPSYRFLKKSEDSFNLKRFTYNFIK